MIPFSSESLESPEKNEHENILIFDCFEKIRQPFNQA